MASFFRITAGKGFGIQFRNGWGISVQFGYGNYCDNYDFPEDEEGYRARNRKAGEHGSSTAECAVFDPSGEMVNLPAFMFDDPEYADIVSNRSNSEKVRQLIDWVADQPAAKEPQ